MDFGDIKRAAAPLLEELDHRMLSDVAGLENSTSEMIAAHFWKRLKCVLPMLSAITVWESDSSRCVYRGPTTQA
jgi:6-pyruvoyltetrahydropterin/6-carboxytetrahydropterin synthase